MHTETLEELSLSFDESVEPLVVDIQGTQHRLTGTVDTQYTEWRELLKQLFVSETGLAPENIEVYREVEPEAVDEVQLLEIDVPAEEGTGAEETDTDADGGAVSGV